MTWLMEGRAHSKKKNAEEERCKGAEGLEFKITLINGGSGL